MMVLGEIVSLMPAPLAPAETAGHQWAGVEAHLGVALPETYKAFVSTYGTGAINQFLWVMNPFSALRTLNLDQMLAYHRSYVAMRDMFPQGYPRPHFPAVGSFLTWAVTENGDSLFWHVDGGAPDHWSVGIHGPDLGEEELTGMTTQAYFVGLLKGELTSGILPGGFMAQSKTFQPFTGA